MKNTTANTTATEKENRGSRKGILKKYDASDEGIKSYFRYLPGLIDDAYPLDIAIAYMYIRLELAQSMTLYCGVVKLHGADVGMAKTAVDKEHITRDSFIKLYESIFGHSIPAPVKGRIKRAEEVRDGIIHGKRVEEEEKRKAIMEILEYAELFNDNVNKKAGLKPFGDLRGFKGAKSSHDKSTSRLILKGIGFESIQ